MDFPEGMNLVYQQRSIKVPVPGVPYSSIEVVEAVSYLAGDDDYDEDRDMSGTLLTERVMYALKDAIKNYEEAVKE